MPPSLAAGAPRRPPAGAEKVCSYVRFFLAGRCAVSDCAPSSTATTAQPRITRDIAPPPAWASRKRIGFLRIDPELGNGSGGVRRGHLPLAAQRIQSGSRDRFGVHFEEAPQCLARVAPAETVGAERDHVTV